MKAPLSSSLKKLPSRLHVRGSRGLCHGATLLAMIWVICSKRFWFTKPPDVTLSAPHPSDQTCVLIISGYDRQSFLSVLVLHYAAMSIIEKVVISWGSAEPFDFLERVLMKSGPQPKVFIRQEAANDLNLRFRPERSESSSCRIIVDDDIYLSEQDLLNVFYVWKTHQNQIVGVFPRSHTCVDSAVEGGRMEYISKPLDSYSMILTKFMVVDNRFLENYFDKGNTALSAGRDLVRRARNCEDIFLNMVVSNLTRLPPVYVKIRNKIDFGTVQGLYKRPDHALQRHQCLNSLGQLFVEFPLLHSYSSLESFATDAFRRSKKDAEKYLKQALQHWRNPTLGNLEKTLDYLAHLPSA